MSSALPQNIRNKLETIKRNLPKLPAPGTVQCAQLCSQQSIRPADYKMFYEERVPAPTSLQQIEEALGGRSERDLALDNMSFTSLDRQSLTLRSEFTNNDLKRFRVAIQYSYKGILAERPGEAVIPRFNSAEEVKRELEQFYELFRLKKSISDQARLRRIQHMKDKPQRVAQMLRDGTTSGHKLAKEVESWLGSNQDKGHQVVNGVRRSLRNQS